jgi:hypothetical protein
MGLMVPSVPPCQSTRFSLLPEQTPGSTAALWTCITRWKLHDLVPAAPEEETTLVGVELDLSIGSVFSFSLLLTFLDECH